jgi:hypothetical protein
MEPGENNVEWPLTAGQFTYIASIRDHRVLIADQQKGLAFVWRFQLLACLNHISIDQRAGCPKKETSRASPISGFHFSIRGYFTNL